MLILAIAGYLIVGLVLMCIVRFVVEKGPLPVLVLLMLIAVWPIVLIVVGFLILNEIEL